MSLRRTMGALILAVVFSGAALANTILDFSTGFAGPGGSLTFAGGTSNPLVGSGIRIGALTAISTPSNAGSYVVTGAQTCTFPALCGSLDFTTGNYQFTDASGLLHFGAGGFVTITGGVSTLGGTTIVPTGTTLLTGAFLGATFDPASGQVSLFLATGTDTKDPTMLAYFGLPTTGTQWSFTGTVQGNPVSVANPGTAGFTTSAIATTDVSNTLVPEPASITLLGTGLLGLAFAIRRRLAG